MLITMHCIFAKINIFKVLFWEGEREGVVTKKSAMCTLLIMLIIMDDPLDHPCFPLFSPFAVVSLFGVVILA